MWLLEVWVDNFICENIKICVLIDEQLYESLTEQDVLTKIQNETGDVFKEIYEYFKA